MMYGVILNFSKNMSLRWKKLLITKYFVVIYVVEIYIQYEKGLGASSSHIQPLPYILPMR